MKVNSDLGELKKIKKKIRSKKNSKPGTAQLYLDENFE